MKHETLHFGIDVVIPKIIELGIAEAPREACGLVVPDLDKRPDDWVIQLVNRADNPLNSYRVEGNMLAQLRLSREVWEDVLVWHTHPSGAVGPSEGDMSSRIPGLKYLVVALPRGEATLF